MEGKAMNAAETNAIAKLPNREGVCCPCLQRLTSTLSGLVAQCRFMPTSRRSPLPNGRVTPLNKN